MTGEQVVSVMTCHQWSEPGLNGQGRLTHTCTLRLSQAHQCVCACGAKHGSTNVSK